MRTWSGGPGISEGEAVTPDAPAVVVVGSANVDRTVRVDRLPRPGETVTGSPPTTAPGGKGLNQAVAARRLGAPVAFVGALGDDDDGRLLRRRLAEEAIHDATTTVDVPTGSALITVDADAENVIVVSPGANAAMDPAAVAAATPLVAGAAVLLTQLEVPIAAVRAALRATTGTRILTPAPVRPLDRDVLDHVDVLVPNRGELVALAGVASASDRGGLVAAARSLGVPTVVVTLGSDGALLVTATGAVHVPAVPVDAVDTTGAGDTFSGALAATLAEGVGIGDAVDLAVVAAALSVTAAGAQAAMPRRGDLDRLRTDRPAGGPNY